MVLLLLFMFGVGITLPPLQKQLAVQRDLLTALIGRLPSQEPAEKFELAALQLPQDLPVSLPSKLVDQRPDIQAAQAQLHAASALIGVAIAAQLPQFTLSGNACTTANHIVQLFTTPGTAFWTVAGNVAQTIFDAGTCCIRNVLPMPPSTRRRQCTAARSSPLSRTSPKPCMR